MKVCFLVSEHPFLDARIFKKEAKSLLKKGYEVTLIVPKIDGHLLSISGKKLGAPFQDNTFFHEGIKIVTYDKVYLENRLKSLNYNIHSTRSERFTDPLTTLGILEEADIYHAHELFSFYSGVGIKRALRELKSMEVKLVYDSHELDPDVSTTSPKKYKLMMEMLQMMLKEVDFVITVSESIKSWFQNLNPHVPVEVIYNSPPLTPLYSPKNYHQEHLLVVYEGIMNETKGNFRKLLEITEICNKKIDLRFKIIGGTKEWDKKSIDIPPHLTDKIELTGWIDYDSLPSELSNAHLGWIDLQPSKSLNHQFAMPNKFFSYLNSGIPVLVNNCTDMKKFLQKYKCGYVVNNNEPTAEEYASAILSLYENKILLQQMSRNARNTLENTYHWGEMEKRLFLIYGNLLNS